MAAAGFKPVTPPVPEQQPGLIQGMVRGIASPFLRAGANLVKAGQVAVGKKVDPAAPVSFGKYLGSYKPVGQEISCSGPKIPPVSRPRWDLTS